MTLLLTMNEITVKVGSKGQVTIPKPFRTALKTRPGMEVIFSVEGDRLVLRRSGMKASALLEGIAKKRKKRLKMHPHEAYEGELEERLG